MSFCIVQLFSIPRPAPPMPSRPKGPYAHLLGLVPNSKAKGTVCGAFSTKALLSFRPGFCVHRHTQCSGVRGLVQRPPAGQTALHGLKTLSQRSNCETLLGAVRRGREGNKTRGPSPTGMWPGCALQCAISVVLPSGRGRHRASPACAPHLKSKNPQIHNHRSQGLRSPCPENSQSPCRSDTSVRLLISSIVSVPGGCRAVQIRYARFHGDGLGGGGVPWLRPHVPPCRHGVNFGTRLHRGTRREYFDSVARMAGAVEEDPAACCQGPAEGGIVHLNSF